MAATGRIVAIGASAGGLESLEHLFAAVPADTGMAFVVVQHLSPDFRSLMDTLLARHTSMTVQMATDGVVLEANHVYLLPPGKQMIVRNRRLLLTERPAQSFQLPIDSFMRALAHDVGEHAVGVILSGTGSDGSRGVVEIKNAGGQVLVEASPKFDGMPQAAIATGVVDITRGARELGRILGALPPIEPDAEPLTAAERTPTEAILSLLHERYGIDFTQYRTTTVGRRISRRLGLTRVPSLPKYVERLRAHPEELDALYHDLLIGVTHFFRDPEAFEALERVAIPTILDALPADQELRVWVAGCATGEEAYTLGIVILDELAARGRTPRVRIHATDVHERSLEHAAAGLYAEDQLALVSAERLTRYFTKEAGGYRVSRELRDAVMFTRHDVIRDAPFTRMHLITCRNMLIYLQPPAQRTVLSLFHFGLAPNGYLMLGASESASVLGDDLVAIDVRWKLFQKRRDIPMITEVRVPSTSAPADDTLLDVYDQLLDLYMPPGFLVDEHGALIDSFAGAERILHNRARRPSAQLLEMIDDELRIIVGAAIQRALRDNAVSYTGVTLDLDGPARCTVVARLLPTTRRGKRHVVVTLKDITRPLPGTTLEPAPAPVPSTHAQVSHVGRLEEALQESNEELQSANEELQASNEELQSVNQELFTVNAEHQRQLVELRDLSADVIHLLEGSDVGTLFLDRELRIRRFTSRVARVFRFKPADLGRHLSDFAHTLQRPQLLDEIAAVRATGAPVGGELHGDDGTHYFMRILRTPEGVILTLTDITALDRARAGQV